MQFKIYGHRRSGTNLARKLIEANFSISYQEENFKHEFFSKLKNVLPYPQSILVERNSRDVLFSQFHFYHNQCKCPFTQDVFKEFLLTSIEKFADKYNPNRRTSDSKAYEEQAKNGETPANFLKRYLEGWGAFPVLRVKYEQFSRKQAEFLEFYGKLIGEKPKQVAVSKLVGPGTYRGNIGYAKDGWYDNEMNDYLTLLNLI